MLLLLMLVWGTRSPAAQEIDGGRSPPPPPDRPAGEAHSKVSLRNGSPRRERFRPGLVRGFGPPRGGPGPPMGEKAQANLKKRSHFILAQDLALFHSEWPLAISYSTVVRGREPSTMCYFCMDQARSINVHICFS